MKNTDFGVLIFIIALILAVASASIVLIDHSRYGIHKIEFTVTSINNTTHTIVAEDKDGWELTFLMNEFNREMHVGDKFMIEVDVIPKQWSG